MEKSNSTSQRLIDQAVWRQCPAPHGHYEVSSSGKVRNAVTLRELKIKPQNRGAPIVSLVHYTHEDWGRKPHESSRSVPRLVAQVFSDLFPNTHNLPCIGYIDDNEMNCALINLRWQDYPKFSNTGVPIKYSAKEKMILAGQQAYWSAMSPEERAEELKQGMPMKGVVIDGVAY